MTTTTTTTTAMNLPAALQAIGQQVRETTHDLHAATAQVRAFLGLPAASHDDEPAPATLPAMLVQMQAALVDTVQAFGQVRLAVRAFVGDTTTVQAEPQLPAHVNGHDVKPEAIPVPLVAPTLAGLPARTIAEQAAQERLAEDAHPAAQDERQDAPAVEVASEPAPAVETPLPASAEDLPSFPDHTTNGQVAHEGELVGVGDDATPGKRGRSTRANRKRN